ncbi:A-kinase anchor protein 6 [Synchiropus splendidus]|uniref:A-kinase anchor protein 6 n=1 Tax=Synchiropus splendidus TaxID=270530 RepID=UPI00237DC001|nr:A-kinase anchor protein 6 [Synchiropus splendidus]
MSVLALSPDPPSPMSVTPTFDLNPATCSSTLLDHPEMNLHTSNDSAGDTAHRSRKPPPLHSGADWKILLHLPEMEKWLRGTSGRVSQLSHSVAQDSEHRHVDVHLVQLKAICEDISDHVEQIHALLETEFSLKLLSCSVNIIVDIRTVQLLWHQLRVSVLVLKERLLQGLQDSNGNFTRQTDILQAFSQDQSQTRLDALTEVDDCGQLTIRCSQDYFSLDCGITAFELSDYSPSDETRRGEGAEPDCDQEEGAGAESEQDEGAGSDSDREEGPGPDADRGDWVEPHPKQEQGAETDSDLTSLGSTGLTARCDLPDPCTPSSSETMSNRWDRPKRPNWNTCVSPQLPTPKIGTLSSDTVSGRVGSADMTSDPHVQIQQDQFSPSLPGPPDRSKFWLQLDSISPEQSLLGHVAHRQQPRQNPSEGDSCSPLPSPVRPSSSSEHEASSEDSDPRPSPVQNSVWIIKRPEPKVSSGAALDQEHWYGSEEFLALPAQLRKPELLSIRLDELPLGQDSARTGLQDVDDWDLMDPVHQDWEELPSSPQLDSEWSSPASHTDSPCPPDSSLDPGPFSDLQSDEDGQEGSRRGGLSLLQQLLDDIQSRCGDQDVWTKIERFVFRLDAFIRWLQESLDRTENWTPPRQDVDSLRVYLDTHLSFKMSVDSRAELKDKIMEEGRELLTIIPQQTGVTDILLMVTSQWGQLQRQIRRQHGWMLRTLRCIQTHLLCSDQPQETTGDTSTNQDAPSPAKYQQVRGPCEVQQAVLEQMKNQLSRLNSHFSTGRKQLRQPANSSSLQEFEVEYQELWDWLMDMDAMVTDSHQLMMSEEQRLHLFKSSHTDLTMMDSKKLNLLGRGEALKRSGTKLPSDFHQKLHDLTHTWTQLEKILSGHSAASSSHQVRPAGSLLVCREGSEDAPPPMSFPLTADLLQQLEARIKELKSWLRDTELLIFNSCLRRDKDAGQQLLSFQSLCSEIQSRRRGVASVLKLCQKLLQQNLVGPVEEVGPEAEQHCEALQLLSINLERRWEAIVMQALQWRNRLRRQLGETQVPESLLEPAMVDLRQSSPPLPGPVAPEESWEWDETDLSITEPDLTQNLPTEQATPPTATRPSNVYQVFSLHSMELDQRPPIPSALQKTEALGSCKDSSFSSLESLPDLLGGLMLRGSSEGEGSSERESSAELGWSSEGVDNGQPSESDSGIVSDAGDAVGISGEQKVRQGEVRRGGSEEWKKGSGEQRGVRLAAEEAKVVEGKTGGLVAVGGGAEGVPHSGGTGEGAEGILALVQSHFSGKLPPSPLSLRGPELTQDLQSTPTPSLGSLESLLAEGVDLFPAQQSCTPVPSTWTPPSTAETEAESGELSRRTLDLLKCLENVQRPPVAKMTSSVSDQMLRSHSRLISSPSLGGVAHLSGQSENSSLASEDTPQGHLCPDSAAEGSTHRKCCRVTGPKGTGLEELDAANLSMLVNVSACTDEEEDDLLSSSSLTLTEEEFGVREGEEDEHNSTTPGHEEDYEAAMVELEYMQKELQSWARPSRGSSSSKSELGLSDELQCSSSPSSSSAFSISSIFSSTCKNDGAERVIQKSDQEEDFRSSRSLLSCFVDDVENGNVEQSGVTGQDEDAELLWEETSTFTRTTVPSLLSPSCELSGPAHQTSLLVGQLKGELPCHSSSTVSLFSVGENGSSNEGGRRAINIQEKFKFSSLVTEKSQREVHDLGFPRHPKDYRCCCGSVRPPEPTKKTDSTHLSTSNGLDQRPGAQIREKVMKLSHQSLHLHQEDFYSYLSLSSHDSDCGEVSLRSVASPSPSSTPPLGPDSDRKDPVIPTSPDIRDEEMLFPACTEEVYLGPPLCYSMEISLDSRSQMLRTPDSTSKPAPGTCEDPPPFQGVVAASRSREKRSNDAPPYLNPRPRVALIDSSAENLVDSKTLPSNMAAVMTEISVSGATTNPLKEPSAVAAHVNPKINFSAMRKDDRMEEARRGGGGGQGGGKRGEELTALSGSSEAESFRYHSDVQTPAAGGAPLVCTR